MELRRFLRENRIVEVFSDYRLIRRNHNYVHVVDFTEFVLFCLRGTRHTGKLVIHSEVVLKRDGRKGLGLGTNQNAFFGFDCLVQTVAVSSSEHQAACEFVNDDDFTVFNDIVDITFHNRFCLQRFDNVMVDFHVFRITKVFNIKEFLRLGNTFVGKADSLFLFFNRIIRILAFAQSVHELVRDTVKVGGVVSLSGNDERCSCFID